MSRKELKQRALIQLREWREEDPAYRGINSLADALDCNQKLLFDWDEYTGVLVELEEDGLVDIVGGECVSAVGRMEWGR